MVWSGPRFCLVGEWWRLLGLLGERMVARSSFVMRLSKGLKWARVVRAGL